MDNRIKAPQMETIRSAADISGLTVHAMRMAVANGDVVSIRVGRKILVNIDSLMRFLNTGIPQGAAAKAAPRCSDKEPAPRISPIPLR